jgi:hypothetical protein
MEVASKRKTKILALPIIPPPSKNQENTPVNISRYNTSHA